jgi:hypothetical protein
MEKLWDPRLDFDLTLPIKQEHVNYVTDHSYPFIRIMDTTDEPYTGTELEISASYSSSGWLIYNYPGVICASYNHYLQQLFLEKNPEAAIGTIIPQTAVTAEEIIDMVLEQQWVGVRILSGSQWMMLEIALQCLENKILLEGGVQPSAEQIANFKWRQEMLRKTRRVEIAPSLDLTL